MNAEADIAIDPAMPGDVAAIGRLLRAAELPDGDFAPHVAHFVVARVGDRVIGAVGAEVCAPAALLRSLVVAPEFRGAGIGDRLIRALEDAAVGWGVDTWWLLTTTAQAFFAARGFQVVARASAPEAIQRTGQFSGGCCRSAVCMTRARK